MIILEEKQLVTHQLIHNIIMIKPNLCQRRGSWSAQGWKIKAMLAATYARWDFSFPSLSSCWADTWECINPRLALLWKYLAAKQRRTLNMRSVYRRVKSYHLQEVYFRVWRFKHGSHYWKMGPTTFLPSKFAPAAMVIDECGRPSGFIEAQHMLLEVGKHHHLAYGSFQYAIDSTCWTEDRNKYLDALWSRRRAELWKNLRDEVVRE